MSPSSEGFVLRTVARWVRRMRRGVGRRRRVGDSRAEDLHREPGWRRGWGDDDEPRISALRPDAGDEPRISALRPDAGDGPRISALRPDAGTEPSNPPVRRMDEEPRYSVRTQGRNLRHFTARGDQPRLTQVILEAARSLSGSLGVVLVEVHDTPREWTAIDMDRSQILEGLLELRDLLGRGGLDLAVFSSDEAVEVFLDRFGTLEIRCGGWHEPRFRGLLEGQGFAHVPALSSLPLDIPDQSRWTEEDTRRVEDVCVRLGLESIADPPGANDLG